MGFRIPKKRRTKEKEKAEQPSDDDSNEEGQIIESPAERNTKDEKTQNQGFIQTEDRKDDDIEGRLKSERARKGRKKNGVDEKSHAYSEVFSGIFSKKDYALNGNRSSTAAGAAPGTNLVKTVADPNAAQDDFGAIFMNIELIKSECDQLDKTINQARQNFTKRGPWILPKKVGEARFKEVARTVLTKMCRHDHYSLFADKVTNEEAPGYSEIVKNPMDFGTMKKKLDDGSYGSGSKAMGAMYRDFLLVFENCALYNEDGDVLEEAARLFGILPLTFATSCVAVISKSNRKSRNRKGR